MKWSLYFLIGVLLVSGFANAQSKKPKAKNNKGLSCSGKIKHTAKATSYYPADDPVEGGFVDCRDTPLKTLQDFLKGKANYVSVAMDHKLKIKYGTKICIPEMNEHYGKNIEFRVVDHGPSFTGKGFSRIDICTDSKKSSYAPIVNGKLTLVFPSLTYGPPCCACK